MATPSVVVLHPNARERYLTAIARLHETRGVDGETEAAKVVREVIETVVIHPASASRNRHTPPPKIEIIGRLEALLGQRLLLPQAIDLGRDGGVTLASMNPEDQGRGWFTSRPPCRGDRW